MGRRRRKCKCCRELFVSHPSVMNQHYCSKKECQQERKRKNNADFKRRNPDYHSGPEAVNRVQRWRRNNPGYWRRGEAVKINPLLNKNALQAEVQSQSVEDKMVDLELKHHALQAEVQSQLVVLYGLACDLNGSALQAELGSVVNRWYDKGARLGSVAGLHYQTNERTTHYAEYSLPSRPAACAESSEAFQLGRPPPGP